MKRIFTLLFSFSVVIAAYADCDLHVSLLGKKWTCYYDNSATVRVSVTGGQAPYSYHWSNNQTDSFNVVQRGEVAVTVTDANNCTASAWDTIQHDTQVTSTRTYSFHLCVEPPYSDLQLVGQGGTGSLTYSVIGIDTNKTGNFPGIPPGDYTFIIADSVGCAEEDDFAVPQPEPFNGFDISVDRVSCVGAADGLIIIAEIPTAIGFYQYRVDAGPGQTDPVFRTTAGEHHVSAINIVTGCSYDTTVTVPSSSIICVGITELNERLKLNLFPNPATNLLSVDFEYPFAGNEELKLEVSNILGQVVRTQSVIRNKVSAIDIGTLPAGLYMLNVKGRSSILASSKFLKE